VIHPRLALVFDMDGVIVDSNRVHREAWRLHNLRHGLQTTEAMLRRMYGRRNDEIVRDFFGPHLSDAEAATHGAAKEQIYREIMASSLPACLVRGVTEFLEKNTLNPVAMATNAEPANVDFVLDRSGLRRFFRVVVNGHQVRRAKPDPEIYLRVAELLGVPAANCVVFEDSHAGVAAARGAGARVVALRTTHPEFPEADLVVDDFLCAELERWLEEQRPVE